MSAEMTSATAAVTESADVQDAAVAARAATAAPRVRLPRRALHGVLLLDKPLGWTSNDALQKVKNLLRAEKAGHTGTLDPLATGLLPLCFGGATKFSQVSLEADKAYHATLRLGQRTEGGDREGQVIEERPVATDRAAVEAACAALTGEIEQLPPMHSALKVQGRALYEYARAGQTVERMPRRVTIHAIDIVDWQAERPETLVINVRCSKGTYIRTLAEDIGERLGCGAHLAALSRTGAGTLSLAQAVTLDDLLGMDDEQRVALLRPVDVLLTDWPKVELSLADAGRFLSGMRRRVELADTPRLRVYGPGGHAFLGSAHVTAGELISDRLLSPIEVEAQLLAAQAALNRSAASRGASAS
ncbi:tRNA pseudouridine(55) synthase TruB [Sphaerotilus microaerophilus]|uniref:tRNA pseudouridine synthase B n=1 Tax=Sphaerotilus microaerophilus TaxID=2914710 RepID=A0ABM7YPF2_9BURK|nr:tRNA pseudouridine(55) synthase TruB [Sphaerotilus sp. FB-5]BDI06375.1 tRNA pseudouridine synthase B [Sphaerotilus sp. FB-5]